MARLSAFNPHELSERTVRAVATGREAPLAEILADIQKNLDGGTMQNLIVSAPRGYGKSFLMRHVQIEAERMAREGKRPLVVLLMPEEMPHVKLPETLMHELTRALTGGASTEAKLAWVEDDDAAFEEAAEALAAAIRAKLGERGLCIAMVENFDRLLQRAFPKEVQRQRLRAFLTARESRLMLIAGSASGAFDRDYDSSFFQAFKEIELLPWTPEECLAFFDRQRQDAGKPQLDDRARARAKAVALFIGGTPRLAALLGDLLIGEDVLSAAELLRRLVDELTPYYKERIEALPGRAQVLLDALLRGGEPATQSELAKRVGAKSQAGIAGPFNDLVRERVVVGEKATGSAEVLYRVADRVFAHYYRFRVIEHGKALCPLEGLVDLLAEFFTPEEKRGKADEFTRIGRLDEARVMARLADFERGETKAERYDLLYGLEQHYIPQRLDPMVDKETAGALRDIARRARAGQMDSARELLNARLRSEIPVRGKVALLLVRSELDAYEGFNGGLGSAEEAVALALRVDDVDCRFEAAFSRTWALFHAERLQDALSEAHRLTVEAEAEGAKLNVVRAIDLVAATLLRLERFADAHLSALRCEALARESHADQYVGRALFLQGIAQFRQAKHDEALRLAQSGIESAHQTGDLQLEGQLLLLTVDCLHGNSHFADMAREALRAAELARDINFPALEAKARYCASLALNLDKKPADALQSAELALRLSEAVGVTTFKAGSFFEAGWALLKLGRFEEGADRFLTASPVAANQMDWTTAAEGYRLAAFCRSRVGDHQGAIDALASASQLLSEHPVEFELATLEQEEAPYTGRRAALIAGTGQETISDVSLSVDEIISAAAQKLGSGDVAAKVLASWISGFVEQTLGVETAPAKLEALARSIAVSLPDRFGAERDRLTAAAAYHAAGRSSAALERLDPDFARALAQMHPPAETRAVSRSTRRKS